MALTKVLVSGPIVTVPVTDFKPSELSSVVTGNTEAIITKNKETLGVYMTVEHRNDLAHQINSALLACEMMSAGMSWEDLRAAAAQAQAGKSSTLSEARNRAKGRANAAAPH